MSRLPTHQFAVPQNSRATEEALIGRSSSGGAHWALIVKPRATGEEARPDNVPRHIIRSRCPPPPFLALQRRRRDLIMCPGSLVHCISRLRPYSVENSRSHSNSEDKPLKARSVLGWGTAREALGCCRLFVIIRGGAPPDNQDRKPVSRLPTHRFAVRGAAQIQVLPRAAFQRHGGTGGPPNHRYANQRPQTPPPWPARRHFP